MTGNEGNGISDFLAKPIIAASGDLTSANLAGTKLFRFDIAPMLTSNTIWNDKIKGFMNMRGTARVRLQINANPFQIGRLILLYIPQYSHSPKTFTTHLTSLMSLTQLPHVQMSLQDAECELEIPYIAPTTHYNKLTGYYDWGTVFCYVYSPLSIGSGGTNQVSYTCWLSFDDFELAVPIVPQMAGGSKSASGKRAVIKKYRVNAIKSNLDSEVNEGSGPISSVLANVSSIASTLYTVPMLSPIAGPAAWFTNLMSGVASAFGWSKPIVDSPICRMAANTHAYMTNTNTSDLSNSLALIADNRVSVMPDVNLSGVDEMSINFIKRQRAWFRTVTWTTTTLPGPLTRFTARPLEFVKDLSSAPVGATSDVNMVDMTPIYFLSRLYQLWRGSIEITMRIVKSQYHTGRLMVCFGPNMSSGTMTNADSNYVHREIIDLRDGSEFCFTVPYCSNQMYSTNSPGYATEFEPVVHINVLNELVAPDTVSSSVEILFEVRGGEDMEFQIPIPFTFSPTQAIVPQGAGDDQSVPVLCNNIGGSTVHDPSTMASQLCIGESSTSLLQLIKRYMKLSSFFTFTGQNKMTIYPYTFGGIYTTGVPTAGTLGPLSNDYLSAFAGCYAHSRGGVRYRIIKDPVSALSTSVGSFIGSLTQFVAGTDAPLVFTTAATYDGLGLNPTEVANAGLPLNPATAFESSYNCGIALSVPMYSRTFARLNRITYDSLANTTYTKDQPDLSLMKLQVVTTGSSFGASTSVYRAASDDFHFSFWLGVPTMGWLNP